MVVRKLKKKAPASEDIPPNLKSFMLPQEQIVVPNAESMKNIKPGESTMRACGWCNYAGSGMWQGPCMIKGKCSIIPLPETDANLLPPVRKLDSPDSAVVDAYKNELNVEKKALEQYKEMRAKFDKTIEFIAPVAAPWEADADAVFGNIDNLAWNTECVLIKYVNSPAFRDLIYKRIDTWISLFEARVKERENALKNGVEMVA